MCDVRQLTVSQRTMLVEALLACRSMGDHQRRQTLLSNLPASIRNGVKITDIARDDALNLLQTSADFANGIQDLLDTIALLDGKESLAYQKLVETVFSLGGTTSSGNLPKAGAADKLKLVGTLNRIMPTQLSQLILLIEMPRGLIPVGVAHGTLVTALLSWADSPTGPGLPAVEKLMQEFIFGKS
jgi:Effector-associated domain 2